MKSESWTEDRTGLCAYRQDQTVRKARAGIERERRSVLSVLNRIRIQFRAAGGGKIKQIRPGGPGTWDGSGTWALGVVTVVKEEGSNPSVPPPLSGIVYERDCATFAQFAFTSLGGRRVGALSK